MANRVKQGTTKSWSSWIPQSRSGRLVVGALALCCFVGSAYVMAQAASQTDRNAEGFVKKYQYVDQSKYRVNR